MINSSTILRLGELGLSGDKKTLLSFLESLAAEAANKNKRSLYNDLKDLIQNYGQTFDLEDSSVNPIKVIENNSIWLQEEIQVRVNQFVALNSIAGRQKISLLSHTNKLLLFGPPGTGKTTLGLYIGEKLGLPVRYVKISDVISSRFGETLKNISQLFDNQTREVVFLDEFDAFAKSRNDTQDIGELKRIVTSIIQTLDFHSQNKIVIVATNLIDTLDTAILRRFAFKINVDYLHENDAFNFFNFLVSSQNEFVFNLTKSDIITLIHIGNLNSVDLIKSLFSKSILFSMVNENKEIGFSSFLDILIDDGVLNKIVLKKMKNNNDPSLKKVISSLQSKGYTQEKISKVFGFHRNSYNKFFK